MVTRRGGGGGGVGGGAVSVTPILHSNGAIIPYPSFAFYFRQAKDFGVIDGILDKRSKDTMDAEDEEGS